MRFNKRVFRDGDTRVVTFFAWFPVFEDAEFWCQMRWLETVTVKQRFLGFGHDVWLNEEFIDE
jgi:hypothetical protein